MDVTRVLYAIIVYSKIKFYPDIGHTIGYGSNMDLQI